MSFKGHYERRFDKNCQSIYLFDDNTKTAVTFEFRAHKISDSERIPSTDISYDHDGILSAIAQALQQGGILPNSATDAELKATKYHLEDMRKLALTKKGDE